MNTKIKYLLIALVTTPFFTGVALADGPIIVSVSPSSGRVDQAQTVTITGSGFGNNSSGLGYVSLSNTGSVFPYTATPIVSWADTRIVFSVPANVEANNSGGIVRPITDFPYDVRVGLDSSPGNFTGITTKEDAYTFLPAGSSSPSSGASSSSGSGNQSSSGSPSSSSTSSSSGSSSSSSRSSATPPSTGGGSSSSSSSRPLTSSGPEMIVWLNILLGSGAITWWTRRLGSN